jgi:Zn-dependent protease
LSILILLLRENYLGLFLKRVSPFSIKGRIDSMKIFGIPVKVEASFLLVLLMASARSSDVSMIAEWGLVVFFSILIHELGHAFAGRAFGLEPQITLYAMGGLTSWADNRKEMKPSQSILISLAGPFSGLLLGGLVFLLQPFYEGDSFLMSVAISDLLWINIAWSIFNLFPILPLDGGHVLESVEEWWRGKRENIISTCISLAVSLLVFGWAISIKYHWVAFLTGWFAWSNASAIIQRIKGRADRSLQEKIDSAREELKNNNGKAVIKLSEEVFVKAKSEQLQQSALELLIYGYVLEMNFEDAEKRLHHYKVIFGANLYMEGFLLYHKGEFDQATLVLQEAFNKENSFRTGELLFHTHLQANRLEQALQLCSHTVLEKNSVYFCHCLQARAFELGQIEFAAQVGLEAFAKTKDPTIAYNIGCAFAQQNHLQEAFNWILCAVQSGFRDRALLETDPDTAEVRKLPEFEQVYRILAEKEIVPV